ncbi:TIGR03960 family B12-binding radical SAM protein [uncultured Ruminococcus sp.]|uniref:TIGR03960 family B12-binding radical SAM protein n=1 Tax=uncultured Ruminococcus sp. TaxID=165186 RepID=UPI00262A9546|nr:TIGR03960 family B12-binding radical SAM protein [uncultured Ruminococcus sp.]
MNVLSKIEPLLMQVQKPAQYIGGEVGSIVKERDKIDVRFAFCFPDTYEIGMSHLGMKILYSLINIRENYWCERVFAPCADFEALMREHDIPLYALESLDAINTFDMVGFTLQYELSYTNILNMLDLAGIPLYAKDRGESLSPIIFAGGPCVCNPEPLADFFDLFILGEGEEVNLEMMDLYHSMKQAGASRSEFLRAAAQIPGIYVPSLYDVTYHEDGTVCTVSSKDDAPTTVQKRIVDDMDKVFYPETFVVPFVETVHDRAVEEVLRGCIRGCRFCQAGFLYRPFREKSPETIQRQCRDLCDSTGYQEISLSSLSTSDHSHLEETLNGLLPYLESHRINLTLPSLRVDNFSKELMDRIQGVRKSSLTFAPEAGTQRLRDVINKNVTEEELMRTAQIAFSGGFTNVKLYFMMGLPTEDKDDIAGIAQLAERMIALFYETPERPKGKSIQISISVATFVPKPFTPFEFEPQIDREQLNERQQYLIESIQPRNRKKIKVSWHAYEISLLEAVLARGDRRLAPVIEQAWRNGSKFDSWSEYFNYENWQRAFDACGIDPAFYANRTRSYDEVFPWDHLDYLVDKSFFIRENQTAHKSQTTPHCRAKCAGCGVNRKIGRACFE